ncbi:putative beta-lysine N-acetyltransferase [Bacillus taeanensis]|uniref:Putative beta-lysine N-acetyltransferase n=1 Tax=Bacillus taeanensis TaxID=273032 RepID=A0A366XRF4_9BACI|nr:putative beta-lysine N-acetyltransferase [Bacillus taeanensis]RBW67705.1 putative beta-lysine N-acetyltransferase [Bacillus taeanensis]
MNSQPVDYEIKIETSDNYTITMYIDYFNSRLRIDDYRGNLAAIAEKVKALSKHYAFSKIIWKAREHDWPTLMQQGYVLEGIFKHYFNGDHAYSMCCYLEQSRKNSNHWLKEDEIITNIYGLDIQGEQSNLNEDYIIRHGTLKDVQQLSVLYDTVFKVYPTPMNEPDYLKKIIKEGTVFYAAEYKGKIISAASAEINYTYHNAELTDCATYIEHRKNGLMKHLILQLEKELKKKQIYCAYSLSRALSFGMNQVFYQLGYQYNGRLINNCYIFDKLEDMNVWVKDLSHS